MKSKRKISKILTSLLLTIVIIITSLVPALAEEQKQITEKEYLEAIIKMIMTEYKFDVNETDIYRDIVEYVLNEKPELLEGMIEASTKSLDEFSEYYSQEDLKSFLQRIDQEYVGIGVVVERITGGIHISQVIPGGSAELAGLKTGDILFSVNGEDATNFSINEAAERIKGKEGTFVNISVRRDGKILDFKIIRLAVSAGSVAYSEFEGGVGYIQIVSFNSQTPDEVKKALDFFETKKIKKIIVDVRDNPGGELGGVLGVLYQFVPRGKRLLTIDYKMQGYDLKIDSQAEFTKTDKEVVVLVNENSASASEVFAGGIMYNNVGVTVGTKTYGKGSVQEFVGLFSLPQHQLGDMKLTVAEYTLPNGESIHKKGITPTHKVKNVYEDVDTNGIMPLLYDKKYTVGDSGYGVLAIKQRLALLGYHIPEVNEVFDEETAVAVKSFQANTELYPYGVCDFTTQKKLGEIVEEAQVLVDKQLDKAYEILTGKKLLKEKVEE